MQHPGTWAAAYVFATRLTLMGFNAAFTVHGDEGSKNIVTFGGMLKAEWSQGITLYAAYDGEWAGDRQVHGGKIGLQVRWQAVYRLRLAGWYAYCANFEFDSRGPGASVAV